MSHNLNNIKCILFDVDGVLTNGDIIYTEKGVEVKCFHVQDGLGITLARLAGLKTGILTSRQSKAVDLRAEQLSKSTGVPTPFDVVYTYSCFNGERIEKIMIP